ncbi:ankyrin repeat domain-containing protein [Endozoicomonas sp. 4G]|uniref:ankyrin repeat domain-containing protein n=1 Tax=Endozoicomonas sp. 4G TaxID=2872754 RepID=UPI002078AE4F|nr:ankyrin repeat domain-containing protein [Endozoicomonas sp. 4G]
MDISQTGTPTGVTHTAPQANSNGHFSGSDVRTLDPQPEMTSQEHNQASATPIADRNVDASLKTDDAQSDCGNSSKAQKRPLPDDPDTVPQLCKMIKSGAMAISEEPATLEEFVDSLVKVITNPDSTDAETAQAVRLISKYGADQLARCTVSFPINNNLSYPAITPFALACRHGKLDLVEALFVNQEQLDQTFDTKGNVPKGRTALMLAVIKGHVNVVKQLLDWGADVQKHDETNLCAEELNMICNNKGKEDTFRKIKQVLKEHREERNLPPFIYPPFRIFHLKTTGEARIYAQDQETLLSVVREVRASLNEQ